MLRPAASFVWKFAAISSRGFHTFGDGFFSEPPFEALLLFIVGRLIDFLKSLSALASVNALSPTERAYPIHGKVMANAVLPTFGLLVIGLVGIVNKPGVYITEDHCMTRSLQQGLVDELSIRRVFVHIVFFDAALFLRGRIKWRLDIVR